MDTTTARPSPASLDRELMTSRARFMTYGFAALDLAVSILPGLFVLLLGTGTLHVIPFVLGVAIAAGFALAALRHPDAAGSYRGAILACFCTLACILCAGIAVPFSYAWALAPLPVIWAARRLSPRQQLMVCIGALFVVVQAMATGATPGIIALRLPLTALLSIAIIGTPIVMWAARKYSESLLPPAGMSGQRRHATGNSGEILEGKKAAADITHAAAEAADSPDIADTPALLEVEDRPGASSANRPDSNDAMDAALTARGPIARLSDDLSAPLTAVIGFVESALENGRLDEEDAESLRIALRNADRIDAILEQARDAERRG